MKILHYGDMTRYLLDLALGQKIKGDTALLLWSGSVQKYIKNVYIRHDKRGNGIESYEVCNPMPIFLREEEEDILKQQGEEWEKKAKEVFLRFFQEIRPDIFHIHTWKGVYREMVWAAKECGIPIVFTAHDFYGISPHISFRYHLDIWRRKNVEESISYYIDLMKEVDYFHFPSKLSRDLYRGCVNITRSSEILLSDIGIYRHPNTKNINLEAKLEIGYMGRKEDSKELWEIVEELDLLEQENISLHIFSDIPVNRPYIFYHNPYTEENKREVFQKLDLILVPSKEYKAYSFTVLEALCYGVPVLMSDKVGAKELVNENKLFVYKEDLKEHLLAILKNKKILGKMRKYIKDEAKIPAYGAHIEKMNEFYKRVLRLTQVSGNYRKSDKILEYRKESRFYV